MPLQECCPAAVNLPTQTESHMDSTVHEVLRLTSKSSERHLTVLLLPAGGIRGLCVRGLQAFSCHF